MRVAEVLAVDTHRARNIVDSVGQQYHRVDVPDRNIADAVERQVVSNPIGAVGADVAQFEFEASLGRRPAAQVKVGAQQAAR